MNLAPLNTALPQGQEPPVDPATGVPGGPLQMVVHPRGLERVVLSLLNLVASALTCLFHNLPGLVLAGLFVWLVSSGHEAWALAPFLLLVLTFITARWAWGR